MRFSRKKKKESTQTYLTCGSVVDMRGASTMRPIQRNLPKLKTEPEPPLNTNVLCAPLQLHSPVLSAEKKSVPVSRDRSLPAVWGTVCNLDQDVSELLSSSSSLHLPALSSFICFLSPQQSPPSFCPPTVPPLPYSRTLLHRLHLSPSLSNV